MLKLLIYSFTSINYNYIYIRNKNNFKTNTMKNYKIIFSIEGIATKTILTLNENRAINLIEKLYNKYGTNYETITLHTI